MSGPYGSRNSVLCHANPLQKHTELNSDLTNYEHSSSPSLTTFDETLLQAMHRRALGIDCLSTRSVYIPSRGVVRIEARVCAAVHPESYLRVTGLIASTRR